MSFKYCQSEIEGNNKCNNQCNNCVDYYSELEALNIFIDMFGVHPSIENDIPIYSKNDIIKVIVKIKYGKNTRR